jgi:chlorite dismutase
MQETATTFAMPAVPLTLDGASVLHQMMKLRWPAWRSLGTHEQNRVLAEAIPVLDRMAARENGQSAVYAMLGHKGDLLFLHFRNSFDELLEAQTELRRLALSEYLEPASSYLSIVELGLYESTQKTYRALLDRGVEPHSTEWNAGIQEVIARQKEAMKPRLYPPIPPNRYLCFYPMDRRRGEGKNWYQVPMADRARQMHEHGLVGRRYAGEVKQIISGSIGFDDWEWGVDLFADSPEVFKRLIYEMRFDEVSAVYALFGPFYIGLRYAAKDLPSLLVG